MRSTERTGGTKTDVARGLGDARSGPIDRTVDHPVPAPSRGRRAKFSVPVAAPRRWTACLVADRSASAAIEFALVGMCVVGLVLEVLQVGLYGYQTAALERATYQASRLIKVGSTSNQNMDATAFKKALCSSLPSGMTCARVIASVRNTAVGTTPNGFYTFVKSDQSGTVQPAMDANTTTFCPGGPSSFVYLQVYYAMPAVSPTWRVVGSATWQNSPVHFLTAQVVFRNEPYASSTTGC